MASSLEHLRERLRRGKPLFDEHYDLILPRPPGNMPFERLAFDTRTRNSLFNAGFSTATQRLGELSVRDALGIKGFGVGCLEVYLNAARHWPDGAEPIGPCVSGGANTVDNGNSALRDASWLYVQIEPEKLAQFLPRPPAGVKLEMLGLDNRTTNALAKAGFASNPERVGDLTVREALNIRGFGIRCLQVYYLAAKRWLVEHNGHSISPRRAAAPSISGEHARKLIRRLRRGVPPRKRERHLRLPRPPEHVRLHRLGFDVRTENALAVAGYETMPVRLGDLTVDQALRLRGFGTSCLQSYLEASFTWQNATAEPQLPLHSSNDQLASRLLDVLGSATIYSGDPRFSSYLRETGCVDTAEVVACLKSPVRPRARVLEAVSHLIRAIERATPLTVEQEAIAVGRAEPGTRNASAIRCYYGFGSGGPKTLQEVAETLGITRERVRQIVTRGAKKCGTDKAFMPVLRRVIALIENCQFSESADVTDELVRQGLVEIDTTAGEVIRYAENIGVDVQVKELSLSSVPVIMPRQLEDAAKNIHSVTLKQIARRGATTLSRVIDDVREPMSAEEVAKLLKCDHRIIPVHTNPDWYSASLPLHESFVRRVSRIICVAGSLSVPELRQAMRRDYRDGAFTPPTSVLSAILGNVPNLRFDGLQARLNVEKQLKEFGGSEDEIGIVDLLRKHGGICERRSLQRQAMDLGISGPNFWRYLSYSSLLARYGEGVYGLVGARLPPGMIEEVQGSRSLVSGGILDRGWTANKTIWIAYRMSDSSLETGIVGIPAALKDILEGDYDLNMPEWGNMGILKVRQAQAWRLSPGLIAGGAEAGDCVVLEFNPRTRTAKMLVGDDSLLDEFVAGD